MKSAYNLPKSEKFGSATCHSGLKWDNFDLAGGTLIPIDFENTEMSLGQKPPVSDLPLLSSIITAPTPLTSYHNRASVLRRQSIQSQISTHKPSIINSRKTK